MTEEKECKTVEKKKRVRSKWISITENNNAYDRYCPMCG